MSKINWLLARQPEDKLRTDIQAMIDECLAALDSLDVKSIRAVRAVLAGKGISKDDDALKGIEAEANQLRAKIAQLRARL